MTDETDLARMADAPVGYPVETDPGAAADPDPDFVGITEHGAPESDGITLADPAEIRSAVWGNRTVGINTFNGQFATWDPCQRNKPCPPHGCGDGCCWYDFSTQVCLEFCTHPGMDIGLARHTALYAARSGRVEFAGGNEFYRPYHVKIRAANGDLDIYGHMWSIDPDVRTAGQVETGQYLGTSGEQTEAGNPTKPDGSGPHLHFEQRSGNGCSLDPTQLLQSANIFLHCKPSPAPEFDGTPQQVGSVTFNPDQRRVTVTFDGLGVRRWASLDGCPTREPLQAGDTVDVNYWIRGDTVQNENRWWVAEDGSRIHVGGTQEKPAAG